MSTRPRNGVIQFEDFHPTSQWEEQEAANILLIHLPGFEKDQIQITYVHSTKIIRVQGERSLPNNFNLRSRFNETYPVPQNCLINKIQGRLHSGTLTITMPKQTITPLNTPKTDAKAPAADLLLPPNPPKTDTKAPAADLLLPPKHSNPPDTKAPAVDLLLPPKHSNPPPADHVQEASSKVEQPNETLPPLAAKPIVEPIVNPPTPKDSKESRAPPPNLETVEPNKSFKDQQPSILPEEKAMSSKILQEAVNKPNVVGSSSTNPIAVPSTSSEVIHKPEMGKVAGIDKEGSKKRKELAIDGDAHKKSKKKEKREQEGKGNMDSLLEKVKKLKDLTTKSVKQVVAIESKEDKQALINAGVAVLVIVVLGTYIAYTVRSSANTKR